MLVGRSEMVSTCTVGEMLSLGCKYVMCAMFSQMNELEACASANVGNTAQISSNMHDV